MKNENTSISFFIPWKMRLAIVGYREYNNFQEFSKLVDAWIIIHGIPDVIISGGGRGTDLLAEVYARNRTIPFVAYPADWQRFGRSAGPIRNKIIADQCTDCLAFVHPKSIGTRNTIEEVRKLGKSVYIIELSEVPKGKIN
jgi:hypothetical protein